MRRLTPLGGPPVEMWTTLPRCLHSHEAEHNQKKRTFDVLPKPDNFIRAIDKIVDFLIERRQWGLSKLSP
jgi:hypothetical protein